MADDARLDLLNSVYSCIEDAYYEQTNPEELEPAKIKETTLYLVDCMELRSFEQLLLATEDDLMATGNLTVFYARFIIQTWKRWNNENVQQAKTNKGGGPRREDTRNRRPLAVQMPAATHKEQEWNFNIKWKDVYAINSGLKNKLQTGMKLKKKDKLELVRRLVNQVRDKVPQAKRSIFRQITRDLKKKYPVTFSSELAKGKLGKKSLCRRMQNRFDNLKRAKKGNPLEYESPVNIKAAYGCRKWRLATLPDGEDAASLKTRQEDLVNYFETQRPSAWDWNYIEDNMEKTYADQRNDINKQAEEIQKLTKRLNRRGGRQSNDEAPNMQVTTSEELRQKWPFLFQPRPMMQHFSTLTEVSMTQKLQKFLEEDVTQLIKFLCETNQGKTKRIKKKMKKAAEELQDPGYNPQLAAVLKLLVQRFKETEDSLWIQVEASDREEEIPDKVTIPTTPRLIIAGDIFDPSKIYFTMDGTILGSAENLVEGTGLLFAAYYVFNLVYDVLGQITLEFIQRCVADINPPRGKKRADKNTTIAAGGKHYTASVHPALTSLSDKFDDFFAEFDPSGSEAEGSEIDNPQ